MGLNMPNPLMVGSCGLTQTVEGIRELAEHGAGAVVLKSIFEEQILGETASLTTGAGVHSEASEYVGTYVREQNLSHTLELIRQAREVVGIPIIASINCRSASEWTSYAREMEQAGADALELNIFMMPAEARQSSEDVETLYFTIVRKVLEVVNIPVAAKIPPYFSSPAHMIARLSRTGLKGLVLFNRFYSPDIDLDQLTLSAGGVLSHPQEYHLPLRWIGLLSGQVKCDLCATTGIHDGDTALKMLLAGAHTVQVASVLYQKGPAYLATMVEEMKRRLDHLAFENMEQVVGRLSRQTLEDPQLYERAQFMKYFSNARF